MRPPAAGRPGTPRLLREEGYMPIMWSVTPGTASGVGAGWILKKAERRIRGGDVLLLHDG
jgi:hypothetical protein